MIERQSQHPFDRSWEVVFDVNMNGSRYVLTRLPKLSAHSPRAADTHFSHLSSRLSPREWQIAMMIAEGQPNKTIARALHISGATVSTHLRRIFVKLGVHSRAEMIARLSGAVRSTEGPGLEPGLTDPKSAVLPLNYPSSMEGILAWSSGD